MGDRRTYYREYKQRMREWAREFGLCLTCMEREPRGGYVVCDYCMDARVAARVAARRRRRDA